MTEKVWQGTWNKDGTGGWHTKTEFLNKDPAKALLEIKEKLYERMDILRTCLGRALDPEYGMGYAADLTERQMMNELQFLENLLDKIERS